MQELFDIIKPILELILSKVVTKAKLYERFSPVNAYLTEVSSSIYKNRTTGHKERDRFLSV